MTDQSILTSGEQRSVHESDPRRKYLVDGNFLTIEELRGLFNAQGAELYGRQLRVFEYVEGKRVLDIGCYYGNFAYHLSRLKPEVEVVGVDYFDDHIAGAEQLYQRDNLKFRKCSVYDLQFADGSFDCVCLQAVIEHLDNPVAALREINRVLKPGGCLIVATDNVYRLSDLISFWRFEVGNRLRRLRKRTAQKPLPVVFHANIEWDRHLYSWNLPTLYTLLHCNGFEYIAHSYAGGRIGWLGRIFPFLEDVIVIKVRKAEDAAQAKRI